MKLLMLFIILMNLLKNYIFLKFMWWCGIRMVIWYILSKKLFLWLLEFLILNWMCSVNWFFGWLMNFNLKLLLSSFIKAGVSYFYWCRCLKIVSCLRLFKCMCIGGLIKFCNLWYVISCCWVGKLNVGCW